MENLSAEQVKDILDKMDFIQGQRAGREHWNDKPFEVQEQDLANFSRDISLIKEYITSQEQRIGKLEAENERLKAQKYYIHSDGRIEMIPTVESVRADTVRKMLERLKADAVAVQYHPGKIGVFVGVGNIDDAAREILECKDER